MPVPKAVSMINDNNWIILLNDSLVKKTALCKVQYTRTDLSLASSTPPN